MASRVPPHTGVAFGVRLVAGYYFVVDVPPKAASIVLRTVKAIKPVRRRQTIVGRLYTRDAGT